MKSQPVLVVFGVITVVFASSHRVEADPELTSVTLGQQTPSAVCRGGIATNIISVTRTGSGDMEVYLTAADLPAGTKAAFSPNPIRFKGNLQSSDASLLLITASGTPPGDNLFRVIATDGQSHHTLTNSSILDVTMCSPGAAPMANGMMCLAFTCLPGQDYRVEAATNLAPPISWTALCTTNAGTNCLLIFVDGDSINFATRFYRMPSQ